MSKDYFTTDLQRDLFMTYTVSPDYICRHGVQTTPYQLSVTVLVPRGVNITRWLTSRYVSPYAYHTMVRVNACPYDLITVTYYS